MGDIRTKKKASLILDYILFVQHNAAEMIKNGRCPTQYGLIDYLTEELNYTFEEAEIIKNEVKELIHYEYKRRSKEVD